MAEEQRPLDSQSWSKWWPPAAPKTQRDPRPRVGRGPPLPACCLHQGVRLKRASVIPQERSPPPRVNLGPRVVNCRLLAPSHWAAGVGNHPSSLGPSLICQTCLWKSVLQSDGRVQRGQCPWTCCEEAQGLFKGTGGLEAVPRGKSGLHKLGTLWRPLHGAA